MKKLHYLLILFAVFLALPAAFAAKGAGPKAKAMAQFDLNQDGKLDATEASAVQKAFAAAPTGELQRFDKDKDGKLSEAEVAAMVPGTGRKGAGASRPAGEPKKAKPGAGKPSVPSDDAKGVEAK